MVTLVGLNDDLDTSSLYRLDRQRGSASVDA